jgi:hypothetical protein
MEDLNNLPYRVSVPELMHQYDCLVIKVNSYQSFHDTRAESMTVLASTETIEGKRLIEILNALRLVCSLLLCLSSTSSMATPKVNEMQSKQVEILESTARRAGILQNLLHTRNSDRTFDHIETGTPHSNNPLVSVKIIETNDGKDEFEWKYVDIPLHDDDDDDDEDSRDGNDNNHIPISTMTREELIQEENTLLQMANTPIPCSSSATDVTMKNGCGVNSTTIRHILCEEWGESKYLLVQSQLQNMSRIVQENCKKLDTR